MGLDGWPWMLQTLETVIQPPSYWHMHTAALPPVGHTRSSLHTLFAVTFAALYVLTSNLVLIGRRARAAGSEVLVRLPGGRCGRHVQRLAPLTPRPAHLVYLALIQQVPASGCGLVAVSCHVYETAAAAATILHARIQAADEMSILGSAPSNWNPKESQEIGKGRKGEGRGQRKPEARLHAWLLAHGTRPAAADALPAPAKPQSQGEVPNTSHVDRHQIERFEALVRKSLEHHPNALATPPL